MNRAEEKVRRMLEDEEDKLWQRRKKLNLLLYKEQCELAQEILMKQKMQECGYCKEKEMKLQKYEEEIEMEKSRECLKALEREKM